MTTPSSEDFNNWIEQFEPVVEENWALALATANLPGEKGEEWLACVEKFNASVKSNWQEMLAQSHRHTVMRWLCSQPAYQSAERLLHKKMSRSSKSDLPSRASFSPNDRPVAFNYLRKIAAQTPADTWSGSIVVALHEYLNVDANVKYQAKKQALKDVQKAMQLLESASLALPDLEKVLRTKVRSLKFWLNRRPPDIERDQKNKAERQFVKSIARVNRRYGSRTCKPDVITELMELDCIRIKLDQRTIARICAEMTKVTKKHNEIVMSNEAA